MNTGTNKKKNDFTELGHKIPKSRIMQYFIFWHVMINNEMDEHIKTLHYGIINSTK